MRLKDNPSACVEPEYRNGRTCRECYFSQVNEKNQWTGSQRCWNAGCIVADMSEWAIAATAGGGMTLDEATEYAERFMGDYAKLLLESTLFMECGKPSNQHAFEIAERKEAQMARDLAEALATAVVGTCKLVDNDSGPDMHCTACGGGVDDEYRYFMDSWGYSRCPHCGSRIIEEATE